MIALIDKSISEIYLNLKELLSYKNEITAKNTEYQMYMDAWEWRCIYRIVSRKF